MPVERGRKNMSNCLNLFCKLEQMERTGITLLEKIRGKGKCASLITLTKMIFSLHSFAFVL